MAKKKRKTSKARKKKVTRKPRTRTKMAALSLADLHAEVQRRLDALEAKRDHLMVELDAVEAEIAEFNGTVAPAPRRKARVGRPRKARATAGARKKAKSTRRKRPRNTTNLVGALKKVLTKKTLSVTDMAKVVQRAGYKTSSPNFRTIVNQTLINNPKIFKRVARGQYTAK